MGCDCHSQTLSRQKSKKMNLFLLKQNNDAAIISVSASNIQHFGFLNAMQAIQNAPEPSMLATLQTATSALGRHIGSLPVIKLPEQIEFSCVQTTFHIQVVELYKEITVANGQTLLVQSAKKPPQCACEAFELYEYLQANDIAKADLCEAVIRETVEKIHRGNAIREYLQLICNGSFLKQLFSVNRLASLDQLFQAIIDQYFVPDECALYDPLVFQNVWYNDFVKELCDMDEDLTLDMICVWLFLPMRFFCKTKLIDRVPLICLQVHQQNDTVSLHFDSNSFVQLVAIKSDDEYSRILESIVDRCHSEDQVKFLETSSAQDDEPKQIDQQVTAAWTPVKTAKEPKKMLHLPVTALSDGDMITDAIFDCGIPFYVAGGAASRALRGTRILQDMPYSDVDLYIFPQNIAKAEYAIQALVDHLHLKYPDKPILAFRRGSCFTIHTIDAITLLQVQVCIGKTMEEIIGNYDLSHATCYYTRKQGQTIWGAHVYGWISNMFDRFTTVMQAHEKFTLRTTRCIKTYFLGLQINNQLHQPYSVWLNGRKPPSSYFRLTTPQHWLKCYNAKIGNLHTDSPNKKRSFDLLLKEWQHSFRQRFDITCDTMFSSLSGEALDLDEEYLQPPEILPVDQLLTIKQVLDARKAPWFDNYNAGATSNSLGQRWEKQVIRSVGNVCDARMSELCRFNLFNVLLVTVVPPNTRYIGTQAIQFHPAGYLYTDMGVKILEAARKNAAAGYPFAMQIYDERKAAMLNGECIFVKMRCQVADEIKTLFQKSNNCLLIDCTVRAFTDFTDDIVKIKFSIETMIFKTALDQLA